MLECLCNIISALRLGINYVTFDLIEWSHNKMINAHFLYHHSVIFSQIITCFFIKKKLVWLFIYYIMYSFHLESLMWLVKRLTHVIEIEISYTN